MGTHFRTTTATITSAADASWDARLEGLTSRWLTDRDHARFRVGVCALPALSVSVASIVNEALRLRIHGNSQWATRWLVTRLLPASSPLTLAGVTWEAPLVETWGTDPETLAASLRHASSPAASAILDAVTSCPDAAIAAASDRGRPTTANVWMAQLAQVERLGAILGAGHARRVFAGLINDRETPTWETLEQVAWASVWLTEPVCA